MAIEYLTIREAALYLDVTRVTIWRWTKVGRLAVYLDPSDNRTRLLRKDDIDKLRTPRPR